MLKLEEVGNQMNKEEWLEDYKKEQLGKKMDKLADTYYKTPGFIKSQILSMMSDSDIAIIIGDKRKEWGGLEFEKKAKLKGLRGDDRKILELIYLDEQKEINKLTKELQYILKSRQGGNQGGFNSEDLQRAKDNIPISEVIQIVAGVKIVNSYRLIRCPLHKDNTASFKIYHKTNSFFCQGCKAGGRSIDFIKHFYNISTGEAIRKLLTLYKK